MVPEVNFNMRNTINNSNYVQSLEGEWMFQIDKTDSGEQEGWFNKDLDNNIVLPGCISGQRKFEHYQNIRQQVWGGEFTDTAIWHPQIKHDYRGATWYRRSIVIPESWDSRVIELYLERVCWKSKLWIGDKEIGTRDSLSTPHRYELGTLTPGRFNLTLMIDNRELHNLGCNTHSYHEGSCTIFNGVLGIMQLRSYPASRITDVQVFSDPETGLCSIKTSILSDKSINNPAILLVSIFDDNGNIIQDDYKTPVNLTFGHLLKEIEVKIPVDRIRLWSEFERPIYIAAITLVSIHGKHEWNQDFAFRTFSTKGTGFLINDRPVLLRGEVNNAQFPLTGHPPMTVAQWKDFYSVFVNFGINHIRFHAWTPPKAAFIAGDDMGIYLQPELPNGEDSVVTDSEDGLKWRIREFDNILREYGNHPSFVLMCMGNEAKTPKIDFLKELVVRGKKHDPRHLYASIANPEASNILDEVEGDDFAIAHGGRDGRRRLETVFNISPPETRGDYYESIKNRPVPQISHEIGQWNVYPDLNEIKKYTGALDPVHLKYFSKSAEAEGLSSQVEKFTEASGKLSLLLYKEEIERSLRTQGYGGFQLLGLQDSFDQGAAYVGQVNSFCEPKSYVTAKNFRQFCSSRVILARFYKRVWYNNETFKVDLEIADYGLAPLGLQDYEWSLGTETSVIQSGSFSIKTDSLGLLPLTNLSIPLTEFRDAVKLQFTVQIRDKEIQNSWNIWVYPEHIDFTSLEDVPIVNVLDLTLMNNLKNGGKAILNPLDFSSDYSTALTPPFWSPIMFPNQKQIIGHLCNAKHKAFNNFPCDAHVDWHWFELLSHGSAIKMEDTSDSYEPIIQGIDHPNRNHKLGLIYETKVGKGRLLICLPDISRRLDERPVARQLRFSLLNYVNSADFSPKFEIDLKKNLPTINKSSSLVGLVKNISANSEFENHWAHYVADNNKHTVWSSSHGLTAIPHPHILTIELNKETEISGFIITPKADDDAGRISEYRLLISLDGDNWESVAEGSWENTPDPKRVELKKNSSVRFIKLESIREVKSKNWTTVAEFDIIKKP